MKKNKTAILDNYHNITCKLSLSNSLYNDGKHEAAIFYLKNSKEYINKLITEIKVEQK